MVGRAPTNETGQQKYPGKDAEHDSHRAADLTAKVKPDNHDGDSRSDGPIDQRRATDSTWGLYVRPADHARALVIDREVMLELMPDVPEDFDPNAMDTSQCPACGDPVAEGASECAGCGLALL